MINKKGGFALSKGPTLCACVCVNRLSCEKGLLLSSVVPEALVYEAFSLVSF